jgi:AcrR family transcriptional regulator
VRRVLDAAAQLADEGGLEAVRMREIAGRANIALGTLYKDFAGKDDVLVALLEREMVLLEQSMGWLRSSGDTYVRRVLAFFDPVTRIMCSRENQTRALLTAVATASPGLAARISAYHVRMTALITRALGGSDAPKSEPRALEAAAIEKLAYMLSQTWFAALIGWMSGLFGVEQVLAHVEAAALWLVRGALAEPA